MMHWQMITAMAGVAPLSPAELARARQYLYGGLAWGAASTLWMLACLAAAYFSGLTTIFQGWLDRRFASAYLRTALATAALLAAVLAALLPFSFYLGFVRERAFGFQHLDAAAWFGQWGISLALDVAAGVVVTAFAYGWMRRRRGPPWWIKIWLVLAVAVVISVALDPVVIEPLFNRFTPVSNPEIRADLEHLARQAGIPHARILEMDASRQSAHTNAYVVGILGTQRIVVYDTLLRTQTPAEIEFVVGHEIGHYVLHHLWKGVGFTLVLLLALLALTGWLYPRWSRGRAPGNHPADPADPAGLALLLFILLAALFLASPLTNGFSRWEEHQADAYGLRLSGQAAAAVQGFEREEHTDLIYPNPPAWVVWWFFNHPSQQERIDFARSFMRPVS
jgi:Zn-dependent protease with chaperone function